MASRASTTWLVPTERDRLMMSVASCFCILFLTFIFQRTFRRIKYSAWLIIYPSAYPASLFLFLSGLRGKINKFIFWFFSHNSTEVILVTIGSLVPSNSVKTWRLIWRVQRRWGASSFSWRHLKCFLPQSIFSYCRRNDLLPALLGGCVALLRSWLASLQTSKLDRVSPQTFLLMFLHLPWAKFWSLCSVLSHAVFHWAKSSCPDSFFTPTEHGGLQGMTHWLPHVFCLHEDL